MFTYFNPKPTAFQASTALPLAVCAKAPHTVTNNSQARTGKLTISDATLKELVAQYEYATHTVRDNINRLSYPLSQQPTFNRIVLDKKPYISHTIPVAPNSPQPSFVTPLQLEPLKGPKGMNHINGLYRRNIEDFEYTNAYDSVLKHLQSHFLSKQDELNNTRFTISFSPYLQPDSLLKGSPANYMVQSFIALINRISSLNAEGHIIQPFPKKEPALFQVGDFGLLNFNKPAHMTQAFEKLLKRCGPSQKSEKPYLAMWNHALVPNKVLQKRPVYIAPQLKLTETSFLNT
jgi:hypothetical protein